VEERAETVAPTNLAAVAFQIRHIARVSPVTQQPPKGRGLKWGAVDGFKAVDHGAVAIECSRISERG